VKTKKLAKAIWSALCGQNCLRTDCGIEDTIAVIEEVLERKLPKDKSKSHESEI